MSIIRLKLGRALVFDLEMTCWEGEPPPGMRREIIEIGIAEIDTADRVITRRAGYLVKPVASEIDPYCTAITGIAPEEVKSKGRPLGEVLRTIEKDFGPGRKTSMAWGDDWSALDADCVALGITNPLPSVSFVNIGHLVSLLHGGGARMGLEEARRIIGLPPSEGRHRALPDAEATAELVLAFASLLPSATLGGQGLQP